MIVNKLRYFRRNKYFFLIISIFILNLFSIIEQPSVFINTNENNYDNINGIPLLRTSSNGPSNYHYFKYYKEITINHSKVSGSSDLINFPLLISLFDSDLHYKVQNDGDDIAFSNGTIWLDHEIESFNQAFNTTHAKLLVWVKIPSLSASIDTKIKMYYGNSTMNSRQNVTGVWDSNYKGVWHLKEDPADSPPQFKDSTSNYNHGTEVNLNTDDQENGQIDGSIDFEGGTGVQDYINCTDDSSLNVGSGEFSLSLWFNYDGGNWGWLAAKGAYIGGIRYSIQITVLDKLRGEIDDNTALKAIETSSYFDDNTWHHVVLVRDETYHWLRFYIDGSEFGSLSISGYGSLDNPQPFYINTITGAPGNPPNGWSSAKLDEVRVSNVARSSDWIATEFNNQENPSSFYSVGDEERTLKQESFNYYKEITIDHTKVSGSSDLINFPLLISLFDSDLQDHTQEDGDDIAFSNGTIWLDHEIELFNQNFNGTHAQLIAWVRIPNLSTTTDTVICMYYDNSAMTNQENPVGVWDSKYLAVHHMEESPVSILYDSTINYESLSTQGSMTSTDLIDAYIGEGIDFDDINDGALSSTAITVNHFTISAWIKPDTMDQWDCFINIGNMDGNYRWIGLNNGVFSVDESSTYDFGTTLSTGKWQNLLITYDGSILRGYINGSFQDSYSSLGWSQITDRFQIGAFAYDNYYHLSDFFDGIIDEVRILNTAISTDWIATEFNNQNDPSSFYSVGDQEIILKQESFNYYKEITIDHTKVSGSSDFINFPLLISLFDSDLQDHTQEDGDDIAFSNGTIWLDHEIELFNQSFNETHSQLIVWVRIPILSTTTDTIIKMYYGNSTMSSRQNPTGVWKSNYMGVWHLSESSGLAKDSTIYAINGTISGDTIQGVNGKVDGCYEFDGDSDEVTLGDPADGHLDFGTNSFMVSFWVNFFGSTLDYQLPFYKGGNMDANPGYEFETNQAGTGLDFQISDGTSQFKSPQLDVDIHKWAYIVGVVDRSSDTQKIYKNGTQVGSATDISSLGNIDNSYNLLFSWDWYSIYGKLDEVRISNTAHSADWIATEFNNQENPSSFYSVGNQEIVLKQENFKYYKEITIDHTKVSGSSDLINFPLLISLFDSDLQNHTQEDGNDIAFYYQNDWLDHEIELFNQNFNGTHAQLIAWVRIPILSTTTDTIIKMYYGNSTMSSRQNPTAVWKSNYMGVWHLSESSGYAIDSTQFSTSGNVIGAIQGMNGQIDGAYDFDGVDDVVNMGDPIDGHLDFGTQSFSFSLWVKCPLTSEYQDIFYKGARASEDAGYCFYRRSISGGGTTTVSVSDGTSRIKNDFSITSNVWEYIVAVIDRSTNILHVYKNGVEQGTGEDISSIGSIDSSFNFRLGDGYNNANVSIDEVRLMKTIYSANWIQNEYNNQKYPQSFLSLSSEKGFDDTPPTYSNLEESADPLELGDTEVITINASDPSSIYQVKIEFEGSNHSMVNIEGDTWQFDSWTPVNVGNYSYTIWIEDNCNNWNNTIGSIEVIDTVAPSYTNLIESADPLQLGQNETISIKVLDSPGSGVNQVLLEYDSINHTMNFIGGNTWSWSNWRPSSTGIYPYKIYMQDMENNWNITLANITVISTTAPFIENLTESADPLELGDYITITIDVYDIEGEVSTVLIELKGVNNTMNFIGGNSYEFNWTWSSVGTVNYKIYASDTDNNWNSLSDSFDIIDTTSPKFLGLFESADPLELGNFEIININCTDLSDIKQVKIEFNNANHTMINIGGNTWQCNLSSPSTTGNYLYTIWAEDDYNNWNYTIGSILVQDKTPPTYSDLIESADPVEIGTPLTITIITTDLSDIDKVLIEFEGSNHSMGYFGGNLYGYDSWFPNRIGVYNYTIYMRDKKDNWNFTTDSITFQDSILPEYTNLIENEDPLELGNSLNIRITVSDFAGINQTLIEFEGSNHSMVNIGGNLWEYSSWIPNNRIVYQYRIFMEDNSGNWNNVTGNITVQDTTPPLAPVITNAPSGDVNGILTFDWLDGSDPSGISFYILIIDNETNPDTTPGYIYFLNITNLGIQSSYLEISEIVLPGRYYYFLSQIDGVGYESSYTMGTFTIVSSNNGNPPNNDNMFFIIIGIILASVIVSTVTIILVKKRVQKNVTPRLKKISFKSITQHINKVSSLQTIPKPDEFSREDIHYEENKMIVNEDLIDGKQMETDLMEIKTLAEELFNEGAYLEAQKQFEIAKDMSMKLGRNEEAKLFSDLIDGITSLIDRRENLLKVLDKVKIEGDTVKLFEIYYDLIQISKKLRDLDAQKMYRLEFIESFQNNNIALSELEDYRLIMEEQIKLFAAENNNVKLVEVYEKYEIITDFLIQLGREEQKVNIDEFRKKNEY